jgi:hypothetical protein
MTEKLRFPRFFDPDCDQFVCGVGRWDLILDADLNRYWLINADAILRHSDRQHLTPEENTKLTAILALL